MPDIFDMVGQWWKKIFAVMILSLFVVGVITFLKPQKYLSITTAVPASSVASDKARIFNENIQELYSALGSPDDLDRMLGTANLDTVYIAITQQFNLPDHYKLKSDEAITKAALQLKRDTKVMKSEYGELKVKVWDTDKNLAPQLANAIMDKLQAIHTDLQSVGNETTLKGLIQGREKLQYQIDSMPPSSQPELQERALKYEKLIGEYQLIVDTKPPVLLIVEKAKAAIKPDKPKRMQIMIATLVLSFLFALLAALVMERRKNTAQ
jgi:LPS O-antigen subunit length determinant protein (WzzB/FepE family)